MNQKLTLENAGDAATFTVSSARTVQTKFGTKLVFSGTDEDGTGVETPLIPDTTGMKQLDRLGLTMETVVGETLTFSRAPNPSGKPYWNIDVASLAPVAPTKRMAPPSPEVVGTSKPVAPSLKATKTVSGVAEAYANLWEQMAGFLSVSCATHQIALSAEAVQSATATVWIALRDHGLQGVSEAPKAQAAPAAPAVKHPAPTGKRLPPPEAMDFSKVPPPSDNDATDDLPF